MACRLATFTQEEGISSSGSSLDIANGDRDGTRPPVSERDCQEGECASRFNPSDTPLRNAGGFFPRTDRWLFRAAGGCSTITISRPLRPLRNEACRAALHVTAYSIHSPQKYQQPIN